MNRFRRSLFRTLARGVLLAVTCGFATYAPLAAAAEKTDEKRRSRRQQSQFFLHVAQFTLRSCRSPDAHRSRERPTDLEYRLSGP